MATLETGLVPLPLSPPQPQVPGCDLLAALPARGGGRALSTVETISQLDILSLQVQQTDLTDDTLETLPVIVSLPSQTQLLCPCLYGGLTLPAVLGKDPLIAVCAVAELILSEEPGQHDQIETEISIIITRITHPVCAESFLLQE